MILRYLTSKISNSVTLNSFQGLTRDWLWVLKQVQNDSAPTIVATLRTTIKNNSFSLFTGVL